MKRRYFHIVERESKDVSGMWRALHATLLILTAISSAVALNSFDDIYDIFNYRCVPYAKQRFVVQDVVYLNVTRDAATPTAAATPDVGNETSGTPPPVTAKPQEFRPVEEGEPVEVEFKTPRKNFVPKLLKQRSHGFDSLTKIPGTQDTYIFEDEIWMKNDTMIGKVTMDMMKTVFATSLTCDYVVYAAMVSIVISTSFAVITLMCAHGGRGNLGTAGVTQPYRYVYVLLISSLMMVIFCGISNNIVDKGFSLFCYRCARFTGSYGCTSVMDYFTPQQKLGKRPFHRDWIITAYSHLITIWLWIAQLILVVLRVITLADFEFRTIFIRKKVPREVEEEDDEEEERLRRALRQKFPDVSRGEILLDEEESDEATRV